MFIITQMGMYIQVNGKTIVVMAEERMSLHLVVVIQDFLTTTIFMARVNLIFLMELIIVDNLT